jgi:putative ABC transport system permease protein
MNLFRITWSYICHKPFNTLLNILLLALGVAIMIVLMVLGKQLQEKITSNARGIDLVVGAKGSPLQLILSSVFHIDFPTGNIPLAEARKIAGNRFVQSAIPLALGDSYAGFRIVGTNHMYTALYHAPIREGKLWEHPFEVTLGETVARKLSLKPGDTFYGGHGIVSGGHTHEDHPYLVAGILDKTHSVLDNLILTSIESVWEMHDAHITTDTDTSSHDDSHKEIHTVHKQGHLHSLTAKATISTQATASKSLPDLPEGEGKEITSLLIKYRSPMAITQFPRYVNSQSALQAASPAFETARLFSLMGVGVQVLEGFAYLIILISGLSIFIALYNSMKERRYDLAIMRSLGTSRFRVCMHIMLEGIFVTLTGGLAGFLLGHGIVELVVAFYQPSADAGISGLVWVAEETWILLLCMILGILASLLPAISAYRTDISSVLAEG